MRRRLNLLVLAVTSFVVVVYTVPLALLVARQAEEAAKADAERLVQSIASQVVDAVATAQSSSLETMGRRLSLPEGTSITNERGEVIGDGPAPGPAVTRALASQRVATAEGIDGEWKLALPVITFEDTLAVHTKVPPPTLRAGVARAWAFLAGLGIVVTVAALVLADRLGRTLREPVEDLAAAAARIGAGDLDTWVGMPDIGELRVVADALNGLVPQLRTLLSEEQTAADLSHRLRTPLAALRLQVENLPEGEREPVLDLVGRVEDSIDRLIQDVRRRDGPPSGSAGDLGAVATAHAAFWAVLAEEQGRTFRWDAPAGPVEVALGDAEIGDLVDTLVSNVFAHTEPRTAFRLSVRRDGGTAVLVVDDDGDGFPPALDPLARGESGGGSTGLGLDIVRRLAQRAGGSATASNRAGGGATVEVRLPLV